MVLKVIRFQVGYHAVLPRKKQEGAIAFISFDHEQATTIPGSSRTDFVNIATNDK